MKFYIQHCYYFQLSVLFGVFFLRFSCSFLLNVAIVVVGVVIIVVVLRCLMCRVRLSFISIYFVDFYVSVYLVGTNKLLVNCIWAFILFEMGLYIWIHYTTLFLSIYRSFSISYMYLDFNAHWNYHRISLLMVERIGLLLRNNNFYESTKDEWISYTNNIYLASTIP